MLTCREFTDFLMEFLDDELPLARRRLFLRHIAACRDCAAYLESYSTTVALARAAWSEPNEAVGAVVSNAIHIIGILLVCGAMHACEDQSINGVHAQSMGTQLRQTYGVLEKLVIGEQARQEFRVVNLPMQINCMS